MQEVPSPEWAPSLAPPLLLWLHLSGDRTGPPTGALVGRLPAAQGSGGGALALPWLRFMPGVCLEEAGLHAPRDDCGEKHHQPPPPLFRFFPWPPAHQRELRGLLLRAGAGRGRQTRKDLYRAWTGDPPAPQGARRVFLERRLQEFPSWFSRNKSD